MKPKRSVASKIFGKIRGGVHPPDNKFLTADKPIRRMDPPETLVIPMQQHIGAPCTPKVKKGDTVMRGTLLGDSEAFVSSPVHSPVSGKVVQVAPQPHPLGKEVLSVIIENDGEDRLDPSVAPPPPWDSLERRELVAEARKAGLVGLGGATFPTHVKLSPPAEYPVDTVILNGAECEPFLTSDYRLMLEEADLIILGLNIIMKAVGARRGIIAIEDNKPSAIRTMEEKTRGTTLSVASLKTKYPQGAEKVLIANLLGREVPSGGLPMHVGVVVNNVGTAHALARYFTTGIPLVERVVTVTGSPVVDPSNLLVPLGAGFRAVVDACGGWKEEPAKVIMGGPMMGLAQYTLDVPVIKGTSGILALSTQEVEYQIPSEPVCIRCGRCVDACPMNLVPTYLASYSFNEKWEEASRLGINDCIECGCCAYTCPTNNPLVQLIKMGKSELARLKRREEARKKEKEEKRGGKGGGNG
jgi:electron transport complex protein RnfC